MEAQISDADLCATRIQAQMLDDRADNAAVIDVVRRVCGVQAQEPAAAGLAIRVRSQRTTISDVDEALLKDRSIVRTWAMRGTLHLMAAGDVGWMVGLLGPVFIAKGRRRRAELGLTDETSDRAAEVICGAIRTKGALSREAVSAHLAESNIPAQGQAAYHLLQYAALKGRICVVPWEGTRPRYALIDEWLEGADGSVPADPAAELALRYIAGYGPVTPADFAAWSGLPRRTAAGAWKRLGGKLKEVTTRDGTAWVLKIAEYAPSHGCEKPLVRLLPGYDNLLLGYENRRWVLAAEHAGRIHPGGGVIRPSILVGNRIAGRWMLERRSGEPLVRVEWFENQPEAVNEEVGAEVQDLSRFLGEDVQSAAGK